MLLRMVEEIKVSPDRFQMSFFHLSLRHEVVLGNDRPLVSLFRQCITFCGVQVMQEMTLAEIQVERSVILMDRLGPDIFSALRMKGHLLHRALVQLKVTG